MLNEAHHIATPVKLTDHLQVPGMVQYLEGGVYVVLGPHRFHMDDESWIKSDDYVLLNTAVVALFIGAS